MKTKIDFNLKVNDPNMFNLYGTMFLIRGFEERVLKLFSEGKIYGTTHTSIGQEAIAVASLNSLTTLYYVIMQLSFIKNMKQKCKHEFVQNIILKTN